MPNYIDKDELIRDLIDKGFYPAIVKSTIENAPTEDVVPRSEVEKVFKNEIECVKRRASNKCNGGTDCEKCDLLMKDTEIINAYEQAIINARIVEKAKQEVAREIFEDIENAHEDCMAIGTNNVANLQTFKFELKLAELKKKYIGK